MSFPSLHSHIPSPTLVAALALLCCTISSLLCPESSSINPKLIRVSEIISLVSAPWIWCIVGPSQRLDIHVWGQWEHTFAITNPQNRNINKAQKIKTSKYPFQIHEYAIYKPNFWDFLLFSWISFTFEQMQIHFHFWCSGSCFWKVSRMCPLVHPSSGPSAACTTLGFPERLAVLLHLFFFSAI